jgi:uncharacterized protein YyaL (SSP411 family)
MINEKELETIISRNIDVLKNKGYIEPGHNGPYYDDETPVRNTAHFISTLYYYYLISNKKELKNYIKTCAEYIISSKSISEYNIFKCRTSSNKDCSNGVIGQAWVIEGLVNAYKATKNIKYIDIANLVAETIPYDFNSHLWMTIDCDGSNKGFDSTFNHQLWYAFSLLYLNSVSYNEKIKIQFDDFIHNINKQ